MNLKSKRIKSAIFLITYAIILMWLLDNIAGVGAIIRKIFAIISPFIIGGALAFIMNSPMMFIEEAFFGKKSLLKNTKDSIKRPISYLITLIIFIVTIIIILFIIIPELTRTIQELTVKIPGVWREVQVFVVRNLIDNPQLIEWINSINVDWNSMGQSAVTFLKDSAVNWVSSTFTFATSFIGGIITFVLAFIFSIYLLFQKETLARQAQKLILAFTSEPAAKRIFYIGSLSNRVFANFLSGQLLEAIILGGLFLIAMTIFKFPYALMISLIIAITALVPMIGAFIGLFIGVLLILVDSSTMAFWFIIMFLIIQQIEGNLIYPHVVGKAAGLPSIWILVAVTVGGSLMGVLGILLFIPVSSILYTLLREEVNERLEEKNIRKV